MGAWPQWRGAHRNGITSRLPASLPDSPDFSWQVELPSEGIGGISSNGQFVVVGSRNLRDTSDIFTCHDLEDGREVWRIVYPALGKLDYGNSPRATASFVDDKVLLQGAFGNLVVANLADGEIVWERNFQLDDGAELPTWGFCGSPLIVDATIENVRKRLVIIQPGVEEAAVVALDLDDGELVWEIEGSSPGYSSMILAEVQGTMQIVGYDQRRICGWSLEGKELWAVTPEMDGDFNVPTPMMVGEYLFLTTENNGSRLYAFDEWATIIPEPHAVFEDMAPDTHSPVVVGDLICGVYDGVFCLNKTDLSLVSKMEGDEFSVYSSIISDGESRVLITTLEANLFLAAVQGGKLEIVDRLKLSDQEVMAHPALVNGRLVLRIGKNLVCLDLNNAG